MPNECTDTNALAEGRSLRATNITVNVKDGTDWSLASAAVNIRHHRRERPTLHHHGRGTRNFQLVEAGGERADAVERVPPRITSHTKVDVETAKPPTYDGAALDLANGWATSQWRCPPYTKHRHHTASRNASPPPPMW
jgi:hypothetical protein